jgi:hypothetical protein
MEPLLPSLLAHTNHPPPSIVLKSLNVEAETLLDQEILAFITINNGTLSGIKLEPLLALTHKIRIGLDGH